MVTVTSIVKEQVGKGIEWVLDFDWEENVLIIVSVGFCILMAIAIGVFVADLIVTEPYTVQGQVVDARYTPASSSVGTGISSSL